MMCKLGHVAVWHAFREARERGCGVHVYMCTSAGKLGKEYAEVQELFNVLWLWSCKKIPDYAPPKVTQDVNLGNMKTF